MSEQNTDVKSLAHTKWNCKYHIVFAPKYRRKPKHTALKKLEGNPGKRKLNMKEPVLEKKNKKFEPFLIL